MSRFTGHLRFFTDNLRFLTFGFVMAFGSSFGQTYFIGVFGPAIRSEFDLTQSSWSAAYMVGTLVSALVLPWTGKKIDRIPLPRYTALVIIALAGSATFMALVPSALLLMVAIFFLRQTGQGLMSHTGSTAMARYFPENRGKAVAMSSLGLAAGEAVLPVLMVITITLIGWRATYGIAALVAALILLPSAMWFLRGHHLRHQAHQDWLEMAGQSDVASVAWSRHEVLKDPRFYLLLPAASAPSLIITALFFHHLTLAELKGWDATWFAGSYWVYAVGSVSAMLATGLLIDRLNKGEEVAVETLVNEIEPDKAAKITNILMEEEQYELHNWQKHDILVKLKEHSVSQWVNQTILNLRRHLIDLKIGQLLEEIKTVETEEESTDIKNEVIGFNNLKMLLSERLGRVT